VDELHGDEEEDVEGVEEPEGAQEDSNASSLYLWLVQHWSSIEGNKCCKKGVM
jgi:hypothetical protein